MLFLNLPDQFGLYAEAAPLFRFHIAPRQCVAILNRRPTPTFKNFAGAS